MLFYSVEDFFRKADAAKRLSRREEMRLAAAMREGADGAKEALLTGYLPFAAGIVRRQPEARQTLRLVLRCCMVLEREAERFDFQQEGETFLHRLSWGLRQAVVQEIALGGYRDPE